MAQNDKGQTIINQNVTSTNQSGGITAHTVTVFVGAARLTFEQSIADDLLQKMPSGKQVHIVGIGGQKDQAVVNEYQSFLQSKGFQVVRSIKGMVSPPPDEKILITDTPNQVIVTIAPSAS